MKRIVLEYLIDEDIAVVKKNEAGERIITRKYPKFRKYDLDKIDKWIKGDEALEYINPESPNYIFDPKEEREEIAVLFLGSSLYRKVEDLHTNGFVYIGLRNFNILDLCKRLKFYTIANVRCVFCYGDTNQNQDRYDFFIGEEMEQPYIPLPEIKIRKTLPEILETFSIFDKDDSDYIGFDYETTDLPEWTPFRIIGFGLSTVNQTHYIDVRGLTDDEMKLYKEYFKKFCDTNYRRMWVYNVNFEQIATYRELHQWYNFEDLMVYVKVFNERYATLKLFVPMILTYVKCWDFEMDEVFSMLENWMEYYHTFYELKNSGKVTDPRIDMNEKWYSPNLFGLVKPETMGYYCGLDAYWTMMTIKRIRETTGDTFTKSYNAIKTNYYLASSIYSSGILLNETKRRHFEDVYTAIHTNTGIMVSYAYYKKLLRELDKLIEGKIVVGFKELDAYLMQKDYYGYTENIIRSYFENGILNLKRFMKDNTWIPLKLVGELKGISNRNVSRKTKLIETISKHYKDIYDKKIDEVVEYINNSVNKDYLLNKFYMSFNEFVLGIRDEFKSLNKLTEEEFIKSMYGEWTNKKASWVDWLENIVNNIDYKKEVNPILKTCFDSYGVIALINYYKNLDFIFYDTIKFRDEIKSIVEYFDNMENFNLLDTNFKENEYPLNQGNDEDNKEYYILMWANTRYRRFFFDWIIDAPYFQPKEIKRLEEYTLDDIRKAKTDDELFDIFTVASILHGDAQKQLSTYLKGFIYDQSKTFCGFDDNNMSTWDSWDYGDEFLLIKPRINVCGVTTKRSSSGFHTTPPECDFMTIFEPESEDRWFVYSDASAAEVKTAIYMSGDEGMIAAVESGEDMYNTIGKLIEGEDKYDPVRRTRYKTQLLGTIYGMGESSSAERLGLDIKIIQSMNKALEKRAPKFWKYVQDTVEFAKSNNGLCKSILGDILEIKDRERVSTQGINYVIQSATSIILGNGFYNIWYQNFKRGLQPAAKAWIHDSITLTIPIKYSVHYYLSFFVDYYDYIYDKYGIHYSQSPKYKFNMRDEMPFKIDRNTGIVTLEGHKHDVEKYIDIMGLKPLSLEKTKDSEYVFKKKIERGRYAMNINNNFNTYEQYKLTYQLELDYLKEVEDSLRNNVFKY